MSENFMQGSKDDAVTVPFSDDESADKAAEDLDDDKPDASPQERVTRAQKRRERTLRMLEEGKANGEKLKALEAEAAANKAELERLKGYLAAQQTQQRSNDTQKDPYAEKLDEVYARQRRAYEGAQADIKAGTMTPERQAYWEREAREIETTKSRLHTQQLLEQDRDRQRNEQGQQIWVQKYPEVYSNPKAFQFAKATYERRQALGEAVTNQLVDDVMQETMTQFKLGAKPAPSATDRARLSGIPSSGTGGGGGKSPGMVMSPEFKRMARAAYPDLSEAEAEKKWVNTTGKRLREKKVV